MEKKAQLPNGQILVFPENTSQEVINSVVKRITGTVGKDEWTSDQVLKIVREMTLAQGQADIDRAKIDNYGPAIEKQTKVQEQTGKALIKTVETVIHKAVDDFISLFMKSEKEKNTNLIKNIDELKTVFKLIADNLGKVSAHSELSSARLERQISDVVKALNANTKATNELAALSEKQTVALEGLVDATRATKIVNRDKNGDIVSIEVGVE
jgi:hypothetical protein